MLRRVPQAGLILGAIATIAACQNNDGEFLPREQLLDPATCGVCHPDHFREWSGSMHAYASTDPVFLAMNARGQRETNGALGDFCVSCHAPMALREGATTDGLNLPTLPGHLQGITCYFCHNVDAVEGTHNNPLRLANDIVMRGGIRNPVATIAHKSRYSRLHDRDRIESADLCGACHDIVTPAGVHLERTFQEWKESLFSHEVPGEQLTCSACHMPGRDGLAAVAPGVPIRRVHSHMWPGVDIALTTFPEADAQRDAVQDELDTTLLAEVCVFPTQDGASAVVTLENVAAGHSWPSGAAQDRRAWIEMIGYDDLDAVIFQSGVVGDSTPLTSLTDPNLWRLGDRIYDDLGQEVHMFWEATSFESELLPAATSRDPTDPDWIDTHVLREYRLPALPARLTMRVRLRPMGLDVLDDLVASGDLDPAIRDAMPTYTLRTTVLEWRADQGVVCVP